LGSTQAAIRPTLIDAEKPFRYFGVPASANNRLLSVAKRVAFLLRERVRRCLEVLNDEILKLVERDVLELSLVGQGGSSHAGNPTAQDALEIKSDCTKFNVLGTRDGMPKRDGDLRLVAVRIAPAAYDVLQVGLLLEGAESMQELLRPVVEEYAKRLEAEPELQSIMDDVEAYRARKAGVERLPRAKGGRPSS
jgi:hypothetical protein